MVFKQNSELTALSFMYSLWRIFFSIYVLMLLWNSQIDIVSFPQEVYDDSWIIYCAQILTYETGHVYAINLNILIFYCYYLKQICYWNKKRWTENKRIIEL